MTIGPLLVALLAAFPGPASAAPANPDSGRAGTHSLTVFVAASLAGAFGEIAREHERRHPGARVRMNAAGSQQLAAQIEQGLGADVFASADETWIRRIEAGGRLAGAPVAFAANRPVVIVSRARGERIRSPADLALPGVKLVLGAPPVPIGRYAREALAKLAALPGYPADYLERALANVVSEEENVNGVVGKVRLGEADAGVVYVSDVTAAVAPHVRVLELPAKASIRATCWIAVLEGSRKPAAREFVKAVTSEHGRRVLAARGFTPLDVK